MNQFTLAQYGIAKEKNWFEGEVGMIKATVTLRDTEVATLTGVYGSKELSITYTDYGTPFKEFFLSDLEKLIMDMNTHEDAPIWGFLDSEDTALMGLFYLLHDLSDMYKWLEDEYSYSPEEPYFFVMHTGSKWWSDPKMQPRDEYIVDIVEDDEGYDNYFAEVNSNMVDHYVLGIYSTQELTPRNFTLADYVQLYTN